MEKVEINHQRGVSILKIQGDIENDDGEHLLEIVQGAEEGALPLWILDMPETNFIDSIALESFLRLAKLLQARRGHLFIARPTADAREILKITHLDSKLRVFNSVEDALEKIFQVQPGVRA